MSQTPSQRRGGWQVISLEIMNPETGEVFELLITDAPAYTAMDRPAYPYLTKNFLFKQSLFKDGSVFGTADVGVGDIEVDNTNGFFDQYRFFGFDGRAVKVYYIDSVSELLSLDNLIFSGILDYPEISTDKIVLHVQNKLKELDVQAQTAFFKGGLPDSLYAGLGPGDPILDPDDPPPSGGGGISEPPAWGEDYERRLDGEENLYGTTKPIIFGRCYSFPLVLVNSSKEIYASNYTVTGDRKPIYSVSRVTDQGVSLVFNKDYANSDDLLDADTPAGNFDTCLAEGLFKLGTPALGDVLADIDTLPIYTNNVATLISQMLVDLLNYDAGVDFSTADLQHLAAKNSCPLGICVLDKEKVIDLVSLIVSSVGGWLATDQTNTFRFGRVDLPDHANSLFTFTDDYIKDGTLNRIQTGDQNRGIPCRQVTVRHTRNWKTLNLGQSLQSVEKYYRLFLAAEFRSATATDDSILLFHPSAPSLTFDTVLVEGQRASILDWNFSSALAGSWTDISVFGSTAVINSDNQLVLTPGAAALAGVSQELSFPGSAIAPGKYRFGFTSISGNNADIILEGVNVVGRLHVTSAFPVAQTDYSIGITIYPSDYTDNGDGNYSLTLTVKNERVGASQIQVLDNLYLQEYMQGLTASMEAQRRLTMLKSDVERFSFAVELKDGMAFNLGDTITIQTDRFSMQDGDDFLILGKVIDADSNEIQFDIWG
jgi:hypothetical protein